MKRIVAWAFGLLLACLPAVPAWAAAAELGSAKAACMIEAESGAALLAENEAQAMPVGGLTRLPALLAVCEAMDGELLAGDAEISVSRSASSVKGPSAFLEAGEVMPAGDLLKAAVMICAGDAIYALGEAAYGSSTALTAYMTDRLTALGVAAAYSDPIGASVQLSAADLVKLGAALMQSGTFRSYATLSYEVISHQDGRTTELASANKMLKSCTGCGGVATGSSSEAGYCGVFAVTRNGMLTISAVIGAANSADRFAAAQNMVDYGYTAYEYLNVSKAGETLADVQVSGGVKGSVALVCRQSAGIALPRGAGYETAWELPDVVEAPVEAGQALGKMRFVSAEGETLAEFALVAAESIAEAKLFDHFSALLLRWLHA